MASTRRDNDFPATSIGRSAGPRFQQQAAIAAAHEGHPLLSAGSAHPSSSNEPTTLNPAGGATLHVNGAPKYVPYTPRQRVTPTSATTGTTVHPSSPQQQGDATSKLQLMHLKAAAQTIGLDNGTLGWLILEKLVSEMDTSEEWAEVWNAVTSGKATLLLPLEAHFTNEKVSADFVKDHIALCDGPSRKNINIVTLSGLRGTLSETTLTFRSTIHPSCKLFQGLLNPITRTNSLTLLPPLPLPLRDISPVLYPTFNVPSYSASLQLPPRSQLATKPPLPPRPSSRTPSASQPASRIPNPFASLFGGNYTKPPAAPVPASPPTSLLSLESNHDSTAPIEICAFTIDRRIVRKDLGKQINKTLKAELKAGLASTASLGNIPVPSWVAERVHDITSEWYPFVKMTTPPLKKRIGAEKEPNTIGYVVNPHEELPEDAAERLQEFYLCLEQDMRVGGTPFIPRRKNRDSDSEVEDDEQREKREQDRMESETRVRDVMDAVERTISSLFYDRLFMPLTSDDTSHDEALSSRVAALNMLDLGLGHLGIDVGSGVNERELDAVVKSCGEILSQLNDCRCPGDKAAALVAAHKIVVDGLSRLPPIRLISEHEAEKDVLSEEDGLKTAKPTTQTLQTPNNANSTDVPPTETSPSSYSNDSASTQSSTPSLRTPSTSSDNEPGHHPSTKEPPPQAKTKSPPPPLPLRPTEGAAALETHSTSKEPTPVSGDVLLPVIIFSVVKANPPHLVSNLLFTQRFRNQSVGGEESYCLINLMAVAEFLENVDMAGLGLGDSAKVLSTADLTPIPLTRSPVTAETPLAPVDGLQAGLRNRVNQQVDAIADSANKVIGGVVDSSFGILRSFMPASQNPTMSPILNRSRPGTPRSEAGGKGFNGLLKRGESGFSIASLAASLPIASRGRAMSGAGGEEAGQQLINVSRPGSLRAPSLRVRVDGSEAGESGEEGTEESEESATGDESSGVEEAGAQSDGFASGKDAKSIRSFESMLKTSRGREKNSRARKSLTDRLANAAGLKGSPPSSRRPSSAQPTSHHQRSPTSSGAISPVHPKLAPPKQRFVECNADDLRLSEVAELLKEYQRLVEGIRAFNGFEE